MMLLLLLLLHICELRLTTKSTLFCFKILCNICCSERLSCSNGCSTLSLNSLARIRTNLSRNEWCHIYYSFLFFSFVSKTTSCKDSLQMYFVVVCSTGCCKNGCSWIIQYLFPLALVVRRYTSRCVLDNLYSASGTQSVGSWSRNRTVSRCCSSKNRS